MSRTRPSTFLALKLVALAAICSVGLIALPGVAAAAPGDCSVYGPQGGAALTDNTINVVAGSRTELRLSCQGSPNVTGYDIDNTSTAGYFDDTTIGSTGTSGPGTSNEDGPNADPDMIGDFVASSNPLGQYQDTFTFTADNGGATIFAPVTVFVNVDPAAPVCTITTPSQDNQTIAQGTSAQPVAFTCAGNGDGPVVVTASGNDDVGTSSISTDGSSFLYQAYAHTSGTETSAYLTAKTANSAASDPVLAFHYTVTDATPVCTPISKTLQGGQDAAIVFSAAAPSCTDTDDSSLTYEAADGSDGAVGTYGNFTITNDQIDYRENADDAANQTTQVTETFNLLVSDGNPASGHTVSVPVTITINPDHAPVCTIDAGGDNQSVLHGNNAITIPITCADPDTGSNPGDANFAVDLDWNTPQTQGNASIDNGTGNVHDTITYTSNYEGYGSDTIAVVASSGATSSTLLIHVNVTDNAPACADASLAMTNDSSDGADLACTDADGDNVNYSIGQAPANGTVYQSGDSFFYYVPNDGFVGTDTFTVIADDDALQTPITVTAHVSAAPPVVVDPPIVTPPVVVAPIVVPVTPVTPVTPFVPPVVIVTPPAPKLSSPVTVKDGKVSLELGCQNQTTSCKANVALTTKLGGKTVSLGTKALTIKPGKNGAIKISLSGAAKQALKAFAGKTVIVKVAVKVTNPTTHGTVTMTKALKVKVPR